MPSKDKMHQIGEVASRVGLSLRTVRYYEEAGLVRPSKRTDGGFRLYGDEEIERLRLVKQMKPLGFTLQEMAQLLKARDQLQRAQPGDPAYERARERLGAFAVTAKRKCEELRGQLETAEGFAADLKRDLRRRAKPTKTPA